MQAILQLLAANWGWILLWLTIGSIATYVLFEIQVVRFSLGHFFLALILIIFWPITVFLLFLCYWMSD